MSAHHLSIKSSLRQFFKELDKLTIQQKLGRGIYQKGQDYYENDAVEELDVADANTVVASVFGTDDYTVKVFVRMGSIQAKCSCPYDTEWSGMCKHIAAVLIKAVEEEFWQEIPEAGDEIEPKPEGKSAAGPADLFEAWLEGLSMDDMKHFIRKLATPAFREEIRLRYGSQGNRDKVFLETKSKIQKLLGKINRYDSGDGLDDELLPLLEKLRGVWTEKAEEVRDLFLKIIEAIDDAKDDGYLFGKYSEESYDGFDLLQVLAIFLRDLPDNERLKFVLVFWETIENQSYDSFSAFFGMASDYLKAHDWDKLKDYLNKSELFDKEDFAKEILAIFEPSMTQAEKGKLLKTLAKQSDKFIVPLAHFHEKEEGKPKQAIKVLDTAIGKLLKEGGSFYYGATDVKEQVMEERIRLAHAQSEPLDNLALQYLELLPKALTMRRMLDLAPSQRAQFELLLRKKNLAEYLTHLEAEKRLGEVVEIVENRRKEYAKGIFSYGYMDGFSRYDFYARNKKELPDLALKCFLEKLENELLHAYDKNYIAVVDALKNIKTLEPAQEFRQRLANLRLVYKRRQNLMGKLNVAFGVQ
ncbi:MAG: SWIM zinc finger family protein [Saprospiraceae bacterium]|nr:SWIM zinc finger family protein [Saprospiraceae bacterium]